MEAVTSPARARRGTRSSALVQTVDIETPELVTFSYTIAGVGSRVAAALIDYLLCLVLFIALLITLAFVGANRLVSFGGTSSEAWALAIVVLGQFFILWGYYVLWEGLADGQTPGKRYMRLRVVSDGGYSVSFAGSAIRNLVRIVDMCSGPSGARTTSTTAFGATTLSTVNARTRRATSTTWKVWSKRR